MRKTLVCSLVLLFVFTLSCKKDKENTTTTTTPTTPTTPNTPALPTPALSISRSSLAIGTYSGYTDTFTVQSNISWAITVSSGAASWLKIDSSKGAATGSTIVKLTVTANNTTATQTGTITIAPVGTSAVSSQVLTITQRVFNLVWQKCVGGSVGESSHAIMQTADGGYVSAGFTYSSDGDVSGKTIGSGWLFKLDGNGNKVWQKTFGSYYEETMQTVTRGSDNGYVAAGYTKANWGTSQHPSADLWVVKFNENGDSVWGKTLGGTGYDGAWKILNTPDGGYLISGETASADGDIKSNHGSYDLWLVKLDVNGNKMWEKTYGGSDADMNGIISATSDGGYYLIGSTRSNDGDATGNHGGTTGTNDILVIKLDGSGNKIWSKCYGSIGHENAFSVVTTPDGGCVFSGFAGNNSGDVSGVHSPYYDDAWVMRLDKNGQKLWQTSLGGYYDEWSESLVALADGTFVIAGFTASNDGDVTGNHGKDDVWAVQLSSDGKKLWQKTFGSSGYDHAAAMAVTSDGGLIISGSAAGNDGDVSGCHDVTSGDAWVLKIK